MTKIKILMILVLLTGMIGTFLMKEPNPMKWVTTEHSSGYWADKNEEYPKEYKKRICGILIRVISFFLNFIVIIFLP